MKKQIVLEQIEETPKVSINQATSYLGLQCNKYKAKYLLFVDFTGQKFYTLARGKWNIAYEKSHDNIKAAVKYYNENNFSVFCFDSQQEQFDWLTEV